MRVDTNSDRHPFSLNDRNRTARYLLPLHRQLQRAVEQKKRKMLLPSHDLKGPRKREMWSAAYENGAGNILKMAFYFSTLAVCCFLTTTILLSYTTYGGSQLLLTAESNGLQNMKRRADDAGMEIIFLQNIPNGTIVMLKRKT